MWPDDGSTAATHPSGSESSTSTCGVCGSCADWYDVGVLALAPPCCCCCCCCQSCEPGYPCELACDDAGAPLDEPPYCCIYCCCSWPAELLQLSCNTVSQAENIQMDGGSGGSVTAGNFRVRKKRHERDWKGRVRCGKITTSILVTLIHEFKKGGRVWPRQTIEHTNHPQCQRENLICPYRGDE